MRRYVLMLGALVAAVGCTSTPASTPSESTNTEQLVKYYRKKNNLPPSTKLAVTGLRDSSITGAKEGTLEIGEGAGAQKVPVVASFVRSEEHTSELQSPCNLVCRLLLEKKKQNT